MDKVLILGAEGLLGSWVSKYFSEFYQIQSLKSRWDSKSFKSDVLNFDGNIIINCIGAIPQKESSQERFDSINYELPKWLDENVKTSCKILHPTTDCEFDGNIHLYESYNKQDKPTANDSYGISKSKFTQWASTNAQHTKILRTSIIGLEKQTKFSLLSWFLNEKKQVNGYTNHFWNGITTLEWAKWALVLIKNWDNFEPLTQLGTRKVSKFELLSIIKQIWNKDISIVPHNALRLQNKTLQTDFTLKSIELQLQQLYEYSQK